jgi:glyoxylate reductase
MNVFLTRRIPDEGIELLRQRYDLAIHEKDRPISKSELVEAVRDADGLLCLLTDPVDTEVIAAAPKLKVISNYAVGYNNIDVEAAKARGIAVTNTPGVLTDATADIAFALMLACARRIAESDRWMRAHEFPGWSPLQFLGQDLREKTLGIIGAGRIGAALARRAFGAYDMRILYTDTQPNKVIETQLRARACGLETLLRESDYVSIHVPLTTQTHHLIGAREIGFMKSSAILVNTARGPVVDEKALIAALREHRIFAAGFDVYEQEPVIPSELKALDNAVILPHIGSASFSTRARMARMAAENLIAVLEGREPEHRVA